MKYTIAFGQSAIVQLSPVCAACPLDLNKCDTCTQYANTYAKLCATVNCVDTEVKIVCSR